MYQDLSTRHDWPVKKDIVDLPIRLNRTSKRISGNSLSPLEARKKDFGEKVDLRRYRKPRLGGVCSPRKVFKFRGSKMPFPQSKTKKNATVYISSVIGKVECSREKWVKQ